MKQTAAILLMLLLVFNITGYRFTVQWMQQNQNAGLEKQLDNADYNEASLIEFSVPLSLPYYNNWPEFERFDGEIEINGATYKYVKRKIQDGHLIVKCLPNPEQQLIKKNVSELFAQVNGLPQHESSSATSKKSVKISLFEYEETTPVSLSNTALPIGRIQINYQTISLLSGISFMPWQPPKNTS